MEKAKRHVWGGMIGVLEGKGRQGKEVRGGESMQISRRRDDRLVSRTYCTFPLADCLFEPLDTSSIVVSGVLGEFFVSLSPDGGGVEAVVESTVRGGGREATMNEMQGPERVKRAIVHRTLPFVDLERSRWKTRGR